jgi:hypothetical protein
MPAKLAFDRHAVWVEFTARPSRLVVSQLLDPAGDIDVELAMEARSGIPHSRGMSRLATPCLRK